MPRRPRPAAESPEQLWERLADSFQSLHCGTWPNQSSEQLYRAAYKLTLLKKGPWLLEKTSEWHADWLQQHLLVKLHPFAQKLEDVHSPLCGEVSTTQREEAFSWVGGVVGVCDDLFRHYFAATTTIAEHLLTYVDKVEETSGSSSVHGRCLEAFTKTMMTGTSVHTEGAARTPTELIGQAIIMDIDYGFSDFHNQLRSLVVTIERSDSKADLSSLMRTMYLDPRRQMYRAAAPVLVNRCSPPEFFKIVRRQLLREELCAHTIIPRSMEEAAKSLVLEEILRPHLQKIMDGNKEYLTVLLQEGSAKELSLVYEVISLVDEDVQSLKSVWQDWLGAQVELARSKNRSGVQEASVSSQSRSVENVKKHADNIVRTAFHADTGFVNIIEEICDI